MKIGRIQNTEGPTLVMDLGPNWVNLSRAFQEYSRSVQGKEAHLPHGIGSLIRRGLLEPGFLARLSEFIQGHQDPDSFRIQGNPRFLLPYRPGKVVAIGRNYRAHVAEFDNKMPQEPIFFCKTAHACIGPGEAILVRESYGRVDHEGELAVVIAKTARDVAPEDARDYIAGYTLANDVTAREMQRKDMADGQPWYRSKNLDTFCPLGPWIVLRDTLPWPVQVDIEVKVNGETKQNSNTAKFIFDLPQLIAGVTRFMTLEPGDIISTGTPEGVSPITPGDTIDITIPQIGTLSNPVAGS